MPTGGSCAERKAHSWPPPAGRRPSLPAASPAPPSACVCVQIPPFHKDAGQEGSGHPADPTLGEHPSSTRATAEGQGWHSDITFGGTIQPTPEALARAPSMAGAGPLDRGRAGRSGRGRALWVQVYHSPVPSHMCVLAPPLHTLLARPYMSAIVSPPRLHSSQRDFSIKHI